MWVFPAMLVACGHALGGSCWHGDFNEERCCVQGDPLCWDELFTKEFCCQGNKTRKVRGDPACWMDGYSYEDCCKEEAKQGCWDDNFGPERCCVDKEFGGLHTFKQLCRRWMRIES